MGGKIEEIASRAGVYECGYSCTHSEVGYLSRPAEM